MKLLFILQHNEITGVNTFIYSFISVLKMKYKEKVSIDIYFPFNVEKPILSKFREHGNVIFNIKENDYDIAYFNFENENGLFDKLNCDKRFFVHGLMTKQNIPTKQYNKVYCFGERSLNYIQSENKQLIRNYVDCNRFKPQSINTKCEKILLHTSRDSGILLTPVLLAANNINAFVNITGSGTLNLQKTWDIENKIKYSDIVVGYGRCAIEAMAMHKAVVIWGLNGGDGMVTENNFWKLAETNFSGWSTRKIEFDLSDKVVDQLTQEFIKYDCRQIQTIYEIINDNFDFNKKVNNLL